MCVRICVITGTGFGLNSAELPLGGVLVLAVLALFDGGYQLCWCLACDRLLS